MRHLIAAVAAALSLTACGSATTAPAAAPATAPATPAAATTPASPCAAASATVAPFRDRARAAWLDNLADPAAMKRQLKALAADASDAFASPAWKTAFAECKTGGGWGDVGELMMWNVDISLAALGIETATKSPESIMRDLAARLDRAVILN
ncbi:hypothetical protein AB0F17_28770 [Nonomuraea sp. NPDC026600]|uniref:hypothetical protein n=1 Tax=Nonomuraea sp. NPDC026600 TaxID=3155363 RepID=UPI0033F8D1AB